MYCFKNVKLYFIEIVPKCYDTDYYQTVYLKIYTVCLMKWLYIFSDVYTILIFFYVTKMF